MAACSLILSCLHFNTLLTSGCSAMAILKQEIRVLQILISSREYWPLVYYIDSFESNFSKNQTLQRLQGWTINSTVSLVHQISHVPNPFSLVMSTTLQLARKHVSFKKIARWKVEIFKVLKHIYEFENKEVKLLY